MKTRFLWESASPWVAVVFAMCFALPVCGAGGLEFGRESVCEAGRTFDDSVSLRNTTDAEIVIDTIGVLLDTVTISGSEIWFSTAYSQTRQYVLMASGPDTRIDIDGDPVIVPAHDSVVLHGFHFGSCLSCVGSIVWSPGNQPCKFVDSEIRLGIPGWGRRRYTCCQRALRSERHRARCGPASEAGKSGQRRGRREIHSHGWTGCGRKAAEAA